MRSEHGCCMTGPPPKSSSAVEQARLHVPALRLSAVPLTGHGVPFPPAGLHQDPTHLAGMLHLPRLPPCMLASHAIHHCACAGNLALCRDADDVKLHRVPLKVMLAQVPPLDALTQYAGMGTLSPSSLAGAAY